VKLCSILSVSSGKGIKVNGLKGGDYSVYGGNGLNGYHSEYLNEEPKLIIGRVGVKCGVTHITKAKSWVTDNALIVEPKNDAFDLKFMQLKLQYENLNKLSVSTAQPVISGSKIYAYEILLPPKQVQQHIVSKIEELFSELDKGIEELKTAQQQLKVYRASILDAALKGLFTTKCRNQILLHHQ
jgi:type I restriction enzyme S subunit